jgi:hypothetical protein
MSGHQQLRDTTRAPCISLYVLGMKGRAFPYGEPNAGEFQAGVPGGRTQGFLSPPSVLNMDLQKGTCDTTQ